MAYIPKPAGPKNNREMFHYIYRELGAVGREIATGSTIEGRWLWNDSVAGGDPGLGYMSGNSVQMGDITALNFSRETADGESIPPDALYQAGDVVLVLNEDRAAYGRYTIVTTDTTSPDFVIFNVIFEVGTGNPAQDNIMDVAYIPQAARSLTAAEIQWVRDQMGAP